MAYDEMAYYEYATLACASHRSLKASQSKRSETRLGIAMWVSVRLIGGVEGP